MTIEENDRKWNEEMNMLARCRPEYETIVLNRLSLLNSIKREVIRGQHRRFNP